MYYVEDNGLAGRSRELTEHVSASADLLDSYSFGALGWLLDGTAWLGSMSVAVCRSQTWLYFEWFVLVATILAVAADAAFDLRRWPRVDSVITLGLRQFCIRLMFLLRAQAWLVLV